MDKMEDIYGELNLTRRSFLKVAGTAAAVAGMASTVSGVETQRRISLIPMKV